MSGSFTNNSSVIDDQVCIDLPRQQPATSSQKQSEQPPIASAKSKKDVMQQIAHYKRLKKEKTNISMASQQEPRESGKEIPPD